MYVIVIGSALRGIIEVIGEFYDESEAEEWLEKNSSKYEKYESYIIERTRI